MYESRSEISENGRIARRVARDSRKQLRFLRRLDELPEAQGASLEANMHTFGIDLVDEHEIRALQDEHKLLTAGRMIGIIRELREKRITTIDKFQTFKVGGVDLYGPSGNQFLGAAILDSTGILHKERWIMSRCLSQVAGADIQLPEDYKPVLRLSEVSTPPVEMDALRLAVDSRMPAEMDFFDVTVVNPHKVLN